MGHDLAAATSTCGCDFGSATLLNGTCILSTLGWFVLWPSIEDLILKQCMIQDPCPSVESVENGYKPGIFNSDYDFIVVGGGAAGSVIASRLSENPKVEVILLEAGDAPPTILNVPALYNSAQNTSYDWQYRTQPQKRACLSTGGVCVWPRGKMLCGTACMSGLMYTRGSPSVYDGWNETNPGWSFEEVLPYFKKSENNTEPKDDIDPGYHGFDGPMRVGYFPYLPDMANHFLAGAEELGIPRTDPNGRHHETLTRAPIMTAHGEMGSPFKMYLRPAMLKPNLHVVTGALVVRVNFDESGSKAIGVEFRDESNEVRTLKAKKEVILCGGVVGSPQLLQLSGIGLKEDLQKLGIRVIRDLAVGENLHFHFGLTITLRLKDNNRNTINWITVYDFLYNRTGPLTSTGLTQVTAFYASTYAENKVPDIQFYMDGYTPKCQTRDYQNRENTVINFRPIYLLTKCRGSIKIQSTNPNDHPLIDPNYLCNGTEVKALLESVEYVRRLINTTALKEVQPEFDTSENTLCARWSGGDDEKYWTCVLEQYTDGENHHAGTCKMGPKTDPIAVVDNELRIHGIPNLRVADASIFPSPINANPIGTIIMIGEKVSDMIKHSWGL